MLKFIPKLLPNHSAKKKSSSCSLCSLSPSPAGGQTAARPSCSHAHTGTALPALIAQAAAPHTSHSHYFKLCPPLFSMLQPPLENVTTPLKHRIYQVVKLTANCFPRGKSSPLITTSVSLGKPRITVRQKLALLMSFLIESRFATRSLQCSKRRILSVLNKPLRNSRQ